MTKTMNMYSHYTLHLSSLGERTVYSSSSQYSSTICTSSSSLRVNGMRCLSTFYAPQIFTFKSRSQDCSRVAQKNQLIELFKDDCEVETPKISSTLEEIEKCIKQIKRIVGSMEGGELTASAYDTAMVGLVEDINGNGNPQFPSCLEWIANNQLDDGSWGAPYLFSVSDRLVNTLACVIALKFWNIHPKKIQKGILFFSENFGKLATENEEHMLIGFEIVFPGLIERARKMNIEVPNDSHPILKGIYAKRDLKLSKIPKEILHTEHTTLLFSLEGLKDLDMERLLKLQCSDGSMLYSPASTAHTLIHTNDSNCFKYLTDVVNRSNGGVPYIYPVDMFARNWCIDQLQRLGISRYFVAEIDELVSYVSRYWDPKRGAYSISNSPFHNIDDTALCFRNLRLHGYKISPDAFWHFKYGDAFCCFPRQSSESVTAIFDLFRASDLQFPGEKVLDETKNFSYKFLREREANNTLVDKWVVLKDLPGEVTYALNMPWYANLPRVETRIYIDQYGGEEDVWIGKTLYQMKEVNNDTYLKLAKLDYNICQEQHQAEWEDMMRWYKNNKLLANFGISEKRLLLSYFLAAANIFEPERSIERIGWAKSTILVEIVSAYLKKYTISDEQSLSLIHGLQSCATNLHEHGYIVGRKLIHMVLETLHQLALDAVQFHGKYMLQPLLQTWEIWLMTLQEKDIIPHSEAVLLATTVNLLAGRLVTEELSSNLQYEHLKELTARICHHLNPYYHNYEVQDKVNNGNIKRSHITTAEIESDMQELLQLVLQKSVDDIIDSNIKQTFLAIAKSFYYTAHCSPSTIDFHMDKVLFQRVI